MMLVDANILLYAVDEKSRAHAAAREWLETALNGSRRVGLPWQSLSAFVRIVTHPRAVPTPLSSSDAWSFVDDWLDAPAAWVPAPGRGYRDLFGRLVRDLDLRGNLVGDAALAALALEHGLAVVSADSDFARFRDVRWLNPIAA
jgi:hypothetical protein